MSKFKFKLYSFLTNLISLFFDIYRVIINNNFMYRMKNIKTIVESSSDCWVLGNGPSLNAELQNYKSEIQSSNIYVVNNFANSDLYTTVKPENYVLLDPNFWNFYDITDNEFLQNLDYFHNNLIYKTTWAMNFYVPSKIFKKKYFQEKFRSNVNIRVLSYNSNTINCFEKINYFAYRHNLGVPFVNNVLGAAIYIALLSSYNRIYIIGADHSWTQSIVVNNKNQVCISDTHFYDKNNSSPKPWLKMNGEYFKMHEILKAFSDMFLGYYELNKFALSIDKKVINLTKKSLIDAFARD